MKKLIFTCALLGVSMTSCGWLLKVEPQKSHYMEYIAQGYCTNPTFTNKSAVDLRIARRVEYREGENYKLEDTVYSNLKPNDILDTSDIQFKLGTRVEYSISWKDWKQGDVIKYELRCSETLAPLKIDIAYGSHYRERLFVEESKEAKASGLDEIWKYL